MGERAETKRMMVRSLLPLSGTITERELLDRLSKDGLSEEEAKRAINDCQAQNEIRWVAFEGWALGGRPS